jgi:hypothetical protein
MTTIERITDLQGLERCLVESEARAVLLLKHSTT